MFTRVGNGDVGRVGAGALVQFARASVKKDYGRA